MLAFEVKANERVRGEDMKGLRKLRDQETDRLIHRQPGVPEAAIPRQLWTERDRRVPPHRRIDSEARPTVEDIAAQIRAERCL